MSRKQQTSAEVSRVLPPVQDIDALRAAEAEVVTPRVAEAWITAPAPTSISKPSADDITTVNALREQLIALNALARERSELADSDYEAISRIEVAVEAFRRAYGAASMELAGTSAGERTRIAGELAAGGASHYLKLVTGSREETVAGLTVTTPAIESAAFRNALSRKGEEAVAAIDSYVTARKAQIAESAGQADLAQEALAALRGHPMTNGLLLALEYGFTAERAWMQGRITMAATETLGLVVSLFSDLRDSFQLSANVDLNRVIEALRREWEAKNPRKATAA